MRISFLLFERPGIGNPGGHLLFVWLHHSDRAEYARYKFYHQNCAKRSGDKETFGIMAVCFDLSSTSDRPV